MENIIAISALLISVFSILVGATQYRRNKKIDLEFKCKERELKKSYLEYNKISAIIYSTLTKILLKYRCSRVYIIQPHPLKKNTYLTINYEVVGEGIAEISTNVQSMKMSDLKHTSIMFIKKPFIFYRCIIEGIKDQRIKSLLTAAGCKSMVVQRLNKKGESDEDIWTGSIVCEFTKQLDEDKIEDIKNCLIKKAYKLSYILPDIDS